MSECNHDCSNCQQGDCASRNAPQSFLAEPNPLSSVKKVIGVVSGKGGVGKSLITSMMAVLLNRRGYHTAILDADVTGPSIPKCFGVKQQVLGTEQGIIPATTKTGIDMISVNLLLEDESAPVVWRGPVIAGVRPVHVRLEHGGIPAAVEVSEMMGSEQHLHLRAGDTEIVAIVPTSGSGHHADAVEIDWLPECIHLFDPNTEQSVF